MRKSSNIDILYNFHHCEIVGYSCQKCKKKGWGETEFVEKVELRN